VVGRVRARVLTVPLGQGPHSHPMSTPQPREGLSRGEFARASGLSPKALRLYERSHLLVPHRVEAGGHRVYLPAQVERARRIRLLRQMDMPLAVVAEVMAHDGGQALERAEAWWRAQEEALRSRRAALAELRLSWGGAVERAPEPVWRVRGEHVAAAKVAAVRARTDQQNLVATLHARSQALRRLLVGQGARPDPGFWVIYHGAVTPDGSAPIEVAVPFTGHAEPEGETVIRVEAAHVRAVCEVRRGDCFYPRIMGAYRAVERWMLQRGAHAAGPLREVYGASWDEVDQDAVFVLVARPMGQVGRG
jgi:DNA-binding transcriptional MerR regulator